MRSLLALSTLLCAGTIISGVGLLAQTPGWETVGVIAGPADLVRVNGTTAYIAAGSTLSVVDVSDPTAPKPRGTVKLPAAVAAMAVSGTTAYVALGLSGMVIVDAASPEKPVVAGAHKTRGETLRIAVSGPRVVISDRMAGAEVVDVTDKAKPVSRGSYYTDGYTRDVALADSTAYIVDSSNDFLIVDTARRGGPEATASAQSSLASSLVAVSAVAQGARTAYVVGAGSLRTYDVSNPTAATPLGTATVSARAGAIALDGRTGYLAAGAEGLQVLDLSDAAKPTVAAVFKTSGGARDVAVAGGLVYVAVAASPASSGGSSPASAGVQILRRR